jgi:undecaprenyl-diphosphatase
MSGFITGIDTHLFFFFNSTISNPVFDCLFPLITNGKFWIIPGIIAVALFIYYKKKNAIIVLALAIITVSISDPVCNRIIKPAVHRLRPCNPAIHIEGAHFLLGRKTSLSFPSSHAMNMFAQAMLFTLFYRKKWPWFFMFAAIIGFSRIYTGVHYPLDVLGGAVLGVCIGSFVYYTYHIIMKRIVVANSIKKASIKNQTGNAM